MMIKKILALILLVLTTSSCSIYHVSSINTTDDYYPPKEVAEVPYIENIEQEFNVIGIVTVNAERRQLISDVLKKMKREAAILGGDAITDIKTDASGVWKRLPAQKLIGNAYVRANYTGSVVVLK
jgi:hypothetical protein